MSTETPQLVISRVFDAPRELVYRAFTDPDHLAAWWGPDGNSLPRDEIEFDVRPGGYQRWTEVNAAEPGLRVHIHVDLTDVADGELLEGVMHVSGRLQEGLEPFATRLRVEVHDEADGRDSRSASGSPNTWRTPASRVGSRRSPSWTPRYECPGCYG
jgi:uncharacterized protein YndB with AHSA1/START domain